jgi:hypothetical protein
VGATAAVDAPVALVSEASLRGSVARRCQVGQAAIDRAATSLSKFRDVVDVDRRGEPAVLGVITATGYGYVRDDGIAVIPIGTLRS